MNLQVRSATLTSINLSWDDFLPREYTSGQYVLYYTDNFSGFVSEWQGQQEVSWLILINNLILFLKITITWQ